MRIHPENGVIIAEQSREDREKHLDANPFDCCLLGSKLRITSPEGLAGRYKCVSVGVDGGDVVLHGGRQLILSRREFDDAFWGRDPSLVIEVITSAPVKPVNIANLLKR